MAKPSSPLARRFPMGAADPVAPLRARFPVRILAEERVRRTFLDTADWRLFAAGARALLEEGPHGTLLLWRRGGEYAELPVANAPRFATDLPDSTVRRRLAAMAQVRALLPVGRQSVRRRRVLVLNGDGKTLVRVHLETATVEDRNGRPTSPPVRTVIVEGLPGYEGTFREVAALFGPADASVGTVDDGLREAAQRWGRAPGEIPGRPTLCLEPHLPAAEAVRRILLAQLAAITANLAGVVEDVDTEFLHDLRVAVRRTRSALAQLGDLLPAAAAPPILEEFRWLGSVTGACRDLDVFRLRVEALRERCPAAEREALTPLLRLLGEHRAAAHGEVAAALASTRCRTLLRRFRRTLAVPRRRGEAIGEVAAGRIVKAFERLQRRGTAVATGPADPALLHRLRIAGKKLRYLLEFFASLYPEDTVAPLVGRLKALQDALGAFHDAALQRDRLAALAQRLASAGGAEAATLLAMGRLVVWLEEEGERHRQEVGPLLQALTAPGVGRRLRSLAPPRGDRPC